MSYSRTYTGSVHYSGSQSYPASESGGTVSYSGEVPVSINLYVDTAPFDSSVIDCTSSVRNLNGAVIAMNSAQIASISKSATEVSNHVTSGFFNMINSELTQNMAALFAKFQAVYELLISRSSTLEKQQLVMQDDYSRLSERYVMIFKNLDEELEKRVITLDKNVFELSKHIQSEQLHSEVAKKVAQFLLGTNEDEIVQQELLIANTKSKVNQAIDGLAENVVQQAVYSNKINSALTEKHCDKAEENYIPVIYAECSNLNSEIKDYNCFSNPQSKQSISKINSAVKSYFTSNNSDSADENEKKQIDEAFSMIAEREFQDLKDEKSIRIYETLKKLKEN